MAKWLLLVAVLAGCRERTQLMIGVATDLRAPDALDEAQLVIGRPDEVPLQVQWQLSGTPNEPFNLPGSYGVFSDGDEFLIEVDLQGFKNGTLLVSRRATMSLVEGQTLFYRMTLVSGCVDKNDCGPTESCIEGACGPRALDSRLFPAFSENLVTELTCASGTNYIDTATNDPMPLSPTASMCPGNLCSEGTCLVPPDNDTPSGDGGIDPGGDDGGNTPVLPPHRFVVNNQSVALNSGILPQFSLDLDGDSQVDNQMGQVLVTMFGQGLDTQQALSSAVAKGDTIMLVNVGASSLAAAQPATFEMFGGTNPSPQPCDGGGDVVCGHHLDGSGTFDLAPDSPVNPPLVGSIAGSMMDAGPGALSLRTSLLGALVDLDLIGARIRLDTVSDDMVSGVIAGGIPKVDVDTEIVPGWAVQFDALMNADCPGSTPPTCGCTSGSTGETLRGLFDSSPSDCTISGNEVRTNGFIASATAPDLTINGIDALSFGIRFTAVRGEFLQP